MTRILVVEDSPTQRQQMQLILESEGFEVELARDGREGLERFAAGTFDAVLSDIVMPESLARYELCQKIKADPRTKGIPVVLLTGRNDPSDIFRSLECGADNFITKPYEPDYLIGRIQTILANRALRSGARQQDDTEVLFMGKRFSIRSDKERILDLLVSSIEDIVQANRDLRNSQAQLAIAKAAVESYASRLEDRVRVSDEKYWGLMEQASDAIFIMEASGTILEVNRQAEEMLRLPRSEILGLDYTQLAPSSELANRKGQLRRILAVGSVRGEAAELQRSDRQTRSVELSASLVGGKEHPLVFAILRDVTERKQLERQLLQSQKLEAMGLLAGGIAHDYNNQLAVIGQYSEILLVSLGPDSPLARHVETIKRTVTQSAGLTRQLLTFSRKDELQTKLLDLNEVVEDVGEMLRPILGSRIRLTLRLDKDLGTVLADPVKLAQILMNLAINARDAMPGGGELSIETCNVELGEAGPSRFIAGQSGPHVMLAVADTGSGMDESTVSRIFEPFFTTKEPGKGTGLGLSTVFGIVQQAGGSIGVDSTLGKGTTFRLYFPQADSIPETP